MIIDFHTHIMSPRIREQRAEYIARDPCFAMLYSSLRAKLATAEELVDGMDKAGIDTSVALNIGWTDHDLCVQTNDYLLEAMSRYPKRIAGFCALQPHSGDLALKELERCIRGGIKGIGELRPDVQSIDLTGESMACIVRLAGEHHLPILLHTDEPVGHQYPGKGNNTPEKIYPFITSFPEVKLVCAHWGSGLPFYALMPEVAAAFKNVYFDTAASNFLYRPAIFQTAINLVGAGKILFGSDYPLVGQGKLIKDIRSLNLPPEAERGILGENAARLLA
jgi:uncharacterized protein